MKQFNANFALEGWIRVNIEPHMEVKPLVAYREKMSGAMMQSGEYTWGDYVIDDYAHYQTAEGERKWSLRRYRDKDATWHLASDKDGKVWFSPTGFFSSKIEELTDWEPTDMVI